MVAAGGRDEARRHLRVVARDEAIAPRELRELVRRLAAAERLGLVQALQRERVVGRAAVAVERMQAQPGERIAVPACRGALQCLARLRPAAVRGEHEAPVERREHVALRRPLRQRFVTGNAHQ